jgi:hypothetical protein
VRERMPHGYHFFPHLLREGDEAFVAVARFLGRAGRAGPPRLTGGGDRNIRPRLAFARRF